MIEDMLIFQNEEQLQAKEVRKEVDSDFFQVSCAEEIAELCGSENKEEVKIEEDSKIEESEHDTEEDIRKEVDSEEEHSEDELNDIEEMIRMCDG